MGELRVVGSANSGLRSPVSSRKTRGAVRLFLAATLHASAAGCTLALAVGHSTGELRTPL
jgi:hypothetical protein